MEHRIINSDRLEVEEEHGTEGEILHLRGRLNIDSSPEFRDRLLTTLRSGSQKFVIVDFAEVTYMDSSGLATLLEALKVARACQSKLCIEGLQGRLLHLFEVTGVLSLFEASNCGTLPTALRRS